MAVGSFSMNVRDTRIHVGGASSRGMSWQHILWAIGFTEAKIKRGPFWMMVALTFLVQLTGMLLLDHSTMPLGVALAVLGVLIANLYAWLVVTAGRCRDAGLSGWLAILTLIPVLGLTGVLIIGIAGSKSGLLTPTPTGRAPGIAAE